MPVLIDGIGLLLGVQKYEQPLSLLLEPRISLTLWKVVYLCSGCRRDDSLLPEFLWSPLFIFSIVTLNKVFAEYFLMGIPGKERFFLRIMNTFKDDSFYILIWSPFVLFYLLRNSHTFLYWPRLLPIRFISWSLHHISLHFLH